MDVAYDGRRHPRAAELIALVEAMPMQTEWSRSIMNRGVVRMLGHHLQYGRQAVERLPDRERHNFRTTYINARLGKTAACLREYWLRLADILLEDAPAMVEAPCLVNLSGREPQKCAQTQMRLLAPQRAALLALKPVDMVIPATIDPAEFIWWHYYHLAALRLAVAQTTWERATHLHHDRDLVSFMNLQKDDLLKNDALTPLQRVKIRHILG